jgi:hypothetical protein
MMREIRVILTQVIDRPATIVRRHFFDMQHHQEHRVHAAAQFRVVEQTEEHCDYEQRTAIGPFTIRERSRLERAGDDLINRCVEGPGRGTVTKFTFRDVGDSGTEVSADITAPVRGLAVLFAPLLRRMLTRGFRQALAEDRFDLEENGYAIAT